MYKYTRAKDTLCNAALIGMLAISKNGKNWGQIGGKPTIYGKNCIAHFSFLHISLSSPFILKPTTNWPSTLLKFRSNRT